MSMSKTLRYVYVSENSSFLSARTVIEKCATGEWNFDLGKYSLKENVTRHDKAFDKYEQKLREAIKKRTVRTLQEFSNSEHGGREELLNLLLTRNQFTIFFRLQKFIIKPILPFAWPVYPQRIPTYLTQCEQYAYLQLGSSLIRADDAISTINEQIARQRDGYFTLSESLHMLREMYSSSPKFLKENIHSAFRKRTLRIYQKPGHPLDFEDQVHDFHFIKANGLDSLLIGRFPGYRFPFAESSNKTTHRLEPGKKTVSNEETHPVQRQRSQENQILKLLTEFSYNPKSLPARKPGKAGVKAEMRQYLDWEGTVFDKAWDRLRARREILGG